MINALEEQYILDRFAALEGRQTALEQLVQEVRKNQLWPWETPKIDKPIRYWPDGETEHSSLIV